MRLETALELRRTLAAANPTRRYEVMRDGRRKPGLAPFYVRVAGGDRGRLKRHHTDTRRDPEINPDLMSLF